MARTLGRTVSTAYFVIDAVMTFRGHARCSPTPDDSSRARDIADTVWHVAHQDRSAWSFDVELRPFGEKW
jgi:hypothetical protein